jgi:hypothetical protein
MERIDITTATRELETRDIDLRYERCRLKDVRAERALLADISARGIERPLAGVSSDERWILLDGFKRLRCARRLEMGYVPCVTLGADEAACITAMLRGPGQKRLTFLEEARFLQELRCAHNMSLGEIAASLGRSKGWASMRLAALADMSETVREVVFRGSFPARAWMYIVRPFTRVNDIDPASTDAFVQAVSGRGHSVREIERLARAYFHGTADTRREIESGHVAMALDELRGASTACSARERACLNDLERVARSMETLPARAGDARLKTGAFRAQAQIVLAVILRRADEFLKAMRSLHDRCGAS